MFFGDWDMLNDAHLCVFYNTPVKFSDMVERLLLIFHKNWQYCCSD